MFIVAMLLGIVIGMFIIAICSITTISELIEENSELKIIRINAERRATQYARKIKQIEDVTFQKGQGSIVDRFDKIKEVISSDQTNK